MKHGSLVWLCQHKHCFGKIKLEVYFKLLFLCEDIEDCTRTQRDALTLVHIRSNVIVLGLCSIKSAMKAVSKDMIVSDGFKEVNSGEK